MADFEVSIGAKLGDALNNLAKLRDEGKITDKQFAQASKTIEKGFAAQSREAKKLAALLKKDVGKDGKAAFDSLKNAAEGFGGKIGGSVAMVEKFGKAAAGIAGPLGPIAGVAAAGALAVGGLAVASFAATEKMIAAADAAADFARAHANMLSEDTTTRLLSLDDAMDTAKLGFGAASATLLAEFAPAMEDAAIVALKLSYAVRDSSDLIVKALDGIVITAELAVQPMRTIAAMFGLAERPAAAFGGAIKGLDTLLAGYNAEAERAIAVTGSKQPDAMKRAADAARDAAKATKEREEADRQYFATWMEGEAQKKAFSAEVMAMVKESKDADRKAYEEELKRMEERKKFHDEIVSMVVAETKAKMDASRAVAAAEMESARLAQQAWMDFATNSFAAVQNFGDLAIQNAQDNDKITQRQAQNRIAVAFALQKTAAVTQAAITGADAYLKMVAFFAPFMGPAALGAAAAITGPMVASQIAVIGAQKAPTFATGGMVGDRVEGDHHVIAASADEGILTGRGVANAGGPAGVESLNRGQAMAPEVKVYIDGVMVANAIANNAGVARVIARALSPHLRGM